MIKLTGLLLTGLGFALRVNPLPVIEAAGRPRIGPRCR